MKAHIRIIDASFAALAASIAVKCGLSEVELNFDEINRYEGRIIGNKFYARHLPQEEATEAPRSEWRQVKQ